jgi:site-specific DNA-methyltransferase (cytosine-N4-specific)
MSLSLRSPDLEQWSDVGDDIGSNADQNYLTHGLFRYFGKLPPVLTSQLLRLFVGPPTNRRPVVLDLMCGSGTTLVEAQRSGIKAIGVDSNPVALLASRVKTHRLGLAEFEEALLAFDSLRASAKWISDAATPDELALVPTFPNRDRWFPPSSQRALARIRHWIAQWHSQQDVHDALLLAWLSIIRAASMASVRTGRIFFDADKAKEDVYVLFARRIHRIYDIFAAIPSEHFAQAPELYLADARTLRLDEPEADLVLLHPPYFALYKYSSDVLRFELEWGGYQRKEIQRREIRDGFKTTDPDLIVPYVQDLVGAVRNGFGNARAGAHV